jgi:hypothetical protein
MGSTGSCRARTTAMTPELRLHGVDLERDGGRGSEAPTFTATILVRAPAPPSFHPPLRSIVSIWHLVYILCVELLHSISKQPQGSSELLLLIWPTLDSNWFKCIRLQLSCIISFSYAFSPSISVLTLRLQVCTSLVCLNAWEATLLKEWIHEQHRTNPRANHKVRMPLLPYLFVCPLQLLHVATFKQCHNLFCFLSFYFMVVGRMMRRCSEK